MNSKILSTAILTAAGVRASSSPPSCFPIAPPPPLLRPFSSCLYSSLCTFSRPPNFFFLFSPTSSSFLYSLLSTSFSLSTPSFTTYQEEELLSSIEHPDGRFHRMGIGEILQLAVSALALVMVRSQATLQSGTHLSCVQTSHLHSLLTCSASLPICG